MSLTITRRYRPKGAAKEVFARRDAEVLIAGPAGTGKSRACLEKLHMMCLVNPGLAVLVVRKTLVSLTATGMVTYAKHVAPEGIASGLVTWYGGSLREPPAYRYNNGSTLVLGGMDKPTKIMSGEYDVVYVQEATELTIEDWESLTSRLRNGKCSFQQMIADCNPDRPTHWLKQRCDVGTTVMLYSKHEDNPLLFNDDGTVTVIGEAYMSKLDALTGVRRLRLRDGIWAAAEGLVYEGWDPSVHLVDIKRPNPEWRRIWSVDFGHTNPFVCQMWAIDHDGRMYLYREFYRTKRLVEDHAKDILASVIGKSGEWKEPRPDAIICDHDAEDRATLERHLGMGTVAARKSVSDGIEAVASRLKAQADGKPRLFICQTALVERDESLHERGLPTCSKQEIDGYVWKKGVDGKPIPDEPNKQDDHGMDAKRYAVAYEDLHPVPRIRFFD